MTKDFHDELVGAGAPGVPERFFDRFMFNLHPTDAATPAVITGFGHYPARDVADGYVIVTDGTQQRNVRFSTELSATAGHGAGPLSFEVVEPNRRWRLQIGPNATGLELDAVWQARTPYWLGEVDVANDHGEPTKFAHLVQSGRWTGVLSLDGEQHSLDGWYGQRDRSRGIRTMAGGQGLHVWFQAQFPDRSVGFLLVEGRDGTRLLLEGSVLHEDGTLDEVVDVRHALRFEALDLKDGVVEVMTARGATYRIAADASAGGGFMAGGGYGGHHGRPRGRDHLESDVYLLDGAVDQRSLDTALTDRVTRFDWDGTTGVGIFEFAVTRSASYSYRPNP